MAGRGKGAFRIAIEDFLETFGFEDILFTWYSGVIEKLEESAIEVYSKTAKMMLGDADLPPGYSPSEFGAIV